MKKIPKFICIVLSLIFFVFPLYSCGKKDYVLELDGGYGLDDDVFSWIVSYCKTQEYNTFMTYLEESGEDTSIYDLSAYDFWRQNYGDDERTLAEIVIEEAVVVGKSYLSAAKQFDEQGLTMTDDDYDAIDSAIEEVESSLSENGETLEEYLEQYGVKESTYRKVLEYQYKSNMLLTRLMSPGGTYEVTDKMVTDSYDETVEAYGYSNVNHVFLYAVSFDSNGDPVELSDEDYNTIKTKAQNIYDAIIAGEAEFEDFLEYSDDKYSPDGYLVSIDTSMTEAFVENSIEMEIGEVRLVESEGIGFHIIKKYELTDENKTEIEDFIRENLEDEAEERIIDKYYDSITADEEKLATFDAATAQLLV